MSQVSSIVLGANITGLDQRTKLNDIMAAFNTTQKGSSRPATVAAGTVWLDDSGGATAWILKFYDGSDDITIGTINTTANTFTPAGQIAAFASSYVNKTGNYTLLNSDYAKVITADATSASFVLSISSTAGLDAGWYAIILKTDTTTNTVTIDPNSSDTINGLSTYVMSKIYQGIIVIRVSSSAFYGIPIIDANSLGGAAFLGLGAGVASSGGNIVIATDAALPGSPTTTTQAGSDNSTKVATTAFAQAAIDQYVQTAGRNCQGTKTVSSSSPSGGVNGDIWYKV